MKGREGRITRIPMLWLFALLAALATLAFSGQAGAGEASESVVVRLSRGSGFVTLQIPSAFLIGRDQQAGGDLLIVQLYAVLPTMAPYFAAPDDERGDRGANAVTIMLRGQTSDLASLWNMRLRTARELREATETEFGLRRVRAIYGSSLLVDLYFDFERGDQGIFFDCVSPDERPGARCRSMSNYEQTLTYEASLPRTALPNWREIDRAVRVLLSSITRKLDR